MTRAASVYVHSAVQQAAAAASQAGEAPDYNPSALQTHGGSGQAAYILPAAENGSVQLDSLEDITPESPRLSEFPEWQGPCFWPPMLHSSQQLLGFPGSCA